MLKKNLVLALITLGTSALAIADNRLYFKDTARFLHLQPPTASRSWAAFRNRRPASR